MKVLRFGYIALRSPIDWPNTLTGEVFIWSAGVCYCVSNEHISLQDWGTLIRFAILERKACWLLSGTSNSLQMQLVDRLITAAEDSGEYTIDSCSLRTWKSQMSLDCYYRRVIRLTVRMLKANCGWHDSLRGMMLHKV